MKKERIRTSIWIRTPWYRRDVSIGVNITVTDFGLYSITWELIDKPETYLNVK